MNALHEEFTRTNQDTDYGYKDFLEDKIAELERQLAEAKEDTARMDCAERHGWSIFFSRRFGMWVVQRNGDVVQVIGKGRTMREAIDQVRKERE